MPVKCILTEQGGKGGGSSIALHSIEVTTPPNRTSYVAGQEFETTGMVITANYAIDNIVISSAAVTGYTVTPSPLTDGVTKVTITYSEGGVTCTTEQAVTVIHALTSITSTKPTKTIYEYGETFESAGMSVTATYSDGKTATVSGWTTSPSVLNTVGTQTITVSYIENSITKTTTFSVIVERKTIPIPSQTGTLTYNTNSQSPNWSNYNTSYMTIGGTTSGINAGKYTATFTPKNNYRWPDKTTTAKDVDWSIQKATGTLNLSTSTVFIDASNYSTGVKVTVTTNSTGTISVTSNNSNVASATVSGKTITIKGNGTTAGTATITVSIAANTNYTAPANKQIAVTATYWTWGNESAAGDASWWAGLKSWLNNSSASERQALVGKTKKMNLSTSVLGANAVTMRCIGYDKDGNKTLVFQSAYLLPNTIIFSDNNAQWIGSNARSYCQDFYNACAAKTSIKTVSKGTCPDYDNSRNANVTYNDETVWLPSEREMGLDSRSPISTANSTTSKAECTKGYNAAYDYYTSNNSRIKYVQDSSGNATNNNNWYWERSRDYDSYYAGYVCYVFSGGGAGDTRYYGSGYLAPAFVIG